MQISTTLQEMVRVMTFKVVKMGQNLHENMEGFRRAGHNYYIDSGKHFKSCSYIFGFPI